MSAAEFEGDTCEDFFLSDGRSPVMLPDTWQEAREAFRGMCEAEINYFDACEEAEAKAFDGYPSGEDAFESDGALHELPLCGARVVSLR